MNSVHSRSFAENLHRAGELFTGDPMARADADMKHVLDALSELGGKPVEMCMPAEARRQPLPDRAVAKILRQQDKDPDDDQGVGTEDVVIPGPEGDIPARVYRARSLAEDTIPPLILYLHGGGWVIAALDSCDATPRALAKKTGAIVVSVHYRQAPEHKFPAAHEDSYAAWQWLLAHGEELGGDPMKAAVVGESAGGNMAINIAIRARDEGAPMPIHQVLIYPVAGKDMTRPSYVENMRARPLNSAMMQWFLRHSLAQRDQVNDPRINLCERDDLHNLPPATIILAEIDPLMSEGEALAQALHDADVWVDATTYDGVTHEFFGMAALVNKAMFAQAQVARNLVEAFAAAGRAIDLD